MKYAALGATAILTISSQPVATRTLSAQSGAAAAIVHSEFLFETAPFPSVHASTIADTREGLVAAWFGGTREGAPDVGIWVSRHAKGAWTAPVEVATGVQADGTRHPCWNPVLFEMPDRSLSLFYKVGPDPRNWWGMVRASKDAARHGVKTTAARRDPGTDQEQAGPARGWDDHQPKQQRVQRQAEPLAHPLRAIGRQRKHVDDRPSAGGGGRARTSSHSAKHPRLPGRPAAGCRADAIRARLSAWSEDGGKTWAAPNLTTLPNPSSGTDAVTLKDGRQLIVYNHTAKGRSPLNVAVSRNGTAWEAALVLESEPGEYSYPAVIQAADGRMSHYLHLEASAREARRRRSSEADLVRCRTAPGRAPDRSSAG